MEVYAAGGVPRTRGWRAHQTPAEVGSRFGRPYRPPLRENRERVCRGLSHEESAPVKMHNSDLGVVHFVSPAGGLLNAQGAQGRPLHISRATFLCIFPGYRYFETAPCAPTCRMHQRRPHPVGARMARPCPVPATTGARDISNLVSGGYKIRPYGVDGGVRGRRSASDPGAGGPIKPRQKSGAGSGGLYFMTASFWG